VPLMLMLSAALAQDSGQVLYLGMEPDPTMLSQLVVVEVGDLTPDQSVTSEDVAALENLASELEGVRPLVDEFDGELAIMSRLDAAIKEVHVVRDEADRELLYKALVFQGFAVHRYFQDTLADDPAAEPYRTSLNGQVAVKAWVDAVALAPQRNPDAEDIPEEAGQLAFDEAAAQIRLAPRGAIVGTGLPEGATLVVDGAPPRTGRVNVAPGYHRVAVVWKDQVVARAEGEVPAEGELTISVGAMASDVEALVPLLVEGPETYGVPPDVLSLLNTLDGPVYLVVPGKRDPLVYKVEGNAALLQVEEADTAFAFHAAVGGGWMTDGDWLLQNVDEGAPQTKGTVNAFTPVVTLGGDLQVGGLALGAGSDFYIPVGEYHTLPSGDATVRMRAYPHVAIGVPVAKVTVGYLFPWQVGLGARASVPVGPVEVGASAVYGLGLSLERDDGSTFEPSNAATGSVTVGKSF
jgi:hypothetical protein